MTDQRSGDDLPMSPVACTTCPRYYWPTPDSGGQCLVCRLGNCDD